MLFSLFSYFLVLVGKPCKVMEGRIKNRIGFLLGRTPSHIIGKKEDIISVGISHPPGVAGLIRTGFISGSPGEDIMRIFKTWILCRIPQ